MTVIDRIRAALDAGFAPQDLDIRDDSAEHAGHAGARGGGHYAISIVSDAFAGKSTVARHRMIYAALDDLMKTQIHALAIRALTASEASMQPNQKEPR
ncbi:BolA family protein [Azoarcus olearius]|uniref:BolA-like protein n=1 Tax=Azoarcus sp. (strain BH72) TaxID=418699 RepID=A1K666_AZOSB|nr:BolA family protein [Azoarcus olearius]ANQ84892.1 putative BolA-like protein [Azoarcus olearius]CAL94321.1 putative BolA-like protein [Azoarcus olearius]